MSAKVIKVAKAVNSVIALGEQDQQALLEVIEDYFTLPDVQDCDRDPLHDDDDDGDGHDDDASVDAGDASLERVVWV